ncbi:MAG: carboxypeptidase regulatory-like domain-containing protein [Myxococcota bacterium]|nr:carboxypeptidase regulatory-like domain-containing protein [Myxococcota bacterium]
MIAAGLGAGPRGGVLSSAALVRSVALALCAVLAVGGIPGASPRPVARDLGSPARSVELGPLRRNAGVFVMVRDAAGGRPIAGVHVRAFAMSENRAYLAGIGDTDPAGQVRLTALPSGEAWITASAAGHARGSSHVVLGPEARSVLIDLNGEHVLDVLVTDDQQAPIPEARIEAVPVGELLPVGARTGRDGCARITRLGPPPWNLTVGAPGYEDVTTRAVDQGAVSKITLRKLAGLTVRVVGPGDAPAAGAHVLIAGASLWPARAAETDLAGEARIAGLSAGTYALRARLDDRVSPIELGVALARGEEKRVLLRLGPGHFVRVRVTDGTAEDAPPVADARVLLVEAGLSPFPLEAKTDVHGAARLGPVASGPATLGASADGFVSRGAVPLLDPPPVETRLALVRSGMLTGRVTDARGFPIAGATIEVVGTDANGSPILDDPRRSSFQAAHFDAVLRGPPSLTASGELGVVPGPVPPIPSVSVGAGSTANALSGATNAGVREVREPWVTRGDGTFRAKPASPGRVRAIVHHPQYVEAESEMVTLLPGGEAQVEVVLHDGGSLEGRVLDANDRPVPRARVFVTARRGSLERMTRAATDGTFAFASLPDAVTLTVSADEDEQPDFRVELLIPEGERKELTLRLPAARSPLVVSVVDGRDRGLAAVQLSASSLSAEVPLRTTAFTDARGEAVLKRAAGIPLRIEATAPGYAPFVLSTDGGAGPVRIELSPAESATGQVVAAGSGEPLAKAEITLTTDVGVLRARSDGRGRYSLLGLPPGAATLVVRAPSFAPRTTPLTIPESGGRRPFAIPRVELTAEGRVEGEVLDARGEPVPSARVAKDHVPTWLVVGTHPHGMVITDAKGRFALGELPEGPTAIEAYAPDVGHARLEGMRILAGRTTVGARLVLTGGEDHRPSEPPASGSVAVTLGQTNAPAQVVIVSVVEGSEAERAGLLADDVIVAVDDSPISTIEAARAKLSGPSSADVVIHVLRGDRPLTMRVAREALRR